MGAPVFRVVVSRREGERLSDENLEPLLGLQEIDGRIDRLAREMKEIPSEKRIHEKEIEGYRKAFEQEKEKAVEVDRQKQKCVDDRKSMVETLTGFKSSLLKLTDNDAYRTMLMQIEHAEKRLGELDIRLLELMYEEETIEKVLEDARKTFERNSARAAKRQEMLDDQYSDLKDRMRKIETEREELCLSIAPRLLDRYQRVRTAGKGLVVVGLECGACGGCHTNVPPQTAVEISQGKTFPCPICGRFIIWTDGSSFAGSGD